MAHEHSSHGPSHYVKIWGILLVLLVVSICGPMLGIRAVTLITAFGIALVKAYIVAAEFMHLRVEKRLATLIIMSMVVIMVLFFFGVAPDVMKDSGQRWMKKAYPVSAETAEAEHN
jgi:caa(3)-type oxidase subunit IV